MIRYKVILSILLAASVGGIAYGQGISYSTSDGKGGWSSPDERVHFADSMGSMMGIHQNVNGEARSCPLAFQDVAYVLDEEGNKTQKLTVSAYRGAAFAVPDSLHVVTNREMRAEIVIEIESVQKGIFVTKRTSAVPFIQAKSGLDADCRTFRNMTWVFSTNTTFSTKDAEYVVKRPGATLKFTKDGVTMDGLEKVEKRESAPPPPNAGAFRGQEPGTSTQKKPNPLGELVRGLVGPVRLVVQSLPHVFKMGSKSSQGSGAIDQIWDHTWGNGTGFYRAGFIAGSIGILLIIGGIGSQAKKKG